MREQRIPRINRHSVDVFNSPFYDQLPIHFTHDLGENDFHRAERGQQVGANTHEQLGATFILVAAFSSRRSRFIPRKPRLLMRHDLLHACVRVYTLDEHDVLSRGPFGHPLTGVLQNVLIDPGTARIEDDDGKITGSVQLVFTDPLLVDVAGIADVPAQRPNAEVVCYRRLVLIPETPVVVEIETVFRRVPCILFVSPAPGPLRDTETVPHAEVE